MNRQDAETNLALLQSKLNELRSFNNIEEMKKAHDEAREQLATTNDIEAFCKAITSAEKRIEKQTKTNKIEKRRLTKQINSLIIDYTRSCDYQDCLDCDGLGYHTFYFTTSFGEHDSETTDCICTIDHNKREKNNA